MGHSLLIYQFLLVNCPKIGKSKHLLHQEKVARVVLRVKMGRVKRNSL